MSSTPRKAAFKAVAATGAIVALTSSGLALAATGHLPTLPDQASDRATEALANRGAETTPDETATTVAEDADSDETLTEDTTDTADAAPSPNLEGLCTAYQANDKAAHGKALDSAAFTALTTAAGSAEGIATFCIDLIGEPEAKDDHTKPAKPTQAATPTKPAKPTQAATPTKPAKPTTAATPERPGKPENASKR